MRFSAAARRRVSAPGARARSPPCFGHRRLVRLAPRSAEHEPAVVVEVAVERRSLAVGDQQQAIGAGLDQIAVVRHQDHRARISS